MATLSNLAAFLAKDDQLYRHPDKSAVVGRVRIGGRVQHRIPGLPRSEGYQRSEFAQLLGPLYVSPRAADWVVALREQYSPLDVIGPDQMPAADSQQEWLEKLAVHVSQRVA